MQPNGTAIRLNTYVDIPVEIGLPYFINDDRMEDGGPLYGNFKLVLQSAICHRGVSVDSGHYISLVRGTIPTGAKRQSSSSQEESDSSSDINQHWMRFDDLAAERITLVDIEKALKDESPYLLFYQILPVNENPDNADIVQDGLPSYAQSENAINAFSRPSFEVSTPEISPPDASSSKMTQSAGSLVFEEPLDVANLRRDRLSAFNIAEDENTSYSTSRRSSIFRGSRSRSRPNSQSGETGMSAAVSRLLDRGRKSTESFRTPDDDPEHSNSDGRHSRSAVGKREKSKQRGLSRSGHREGKQRQWSSLTNDDLTPERECTVM